MIKLHLYDPKLARKISRRPVASPLARVQAAAGAKVPTLLHFTVELDEFERHVIEYLDGSRDRRTLLEDLAALAAQGALKVQKTGVPVTNAAKLRSALANRLDQCLDRFLTLGLLAG